MLHAKSDQRHPGHVGWQCTARSFLRACLLTLLVSTVSGQEGLTESDGGGDEDSAEVEEVSPSGRYVNLQPEFVLNYGNSDRLRFARLEITVVGEDLEAAADINHHSPALRHIVVMTLTQAETQKIAGTQGRQALREALREEMRSFLEEEAGSPLVSDVLFSNFIVN